MYQSTKFHLPRCSDLLVNVNKPKANLKLRRQPSGYFAFYKHTSKELSIFAKSVGDSLSVASPHIRAFAMLFLLTVGS
jgi:hypothetical protein